MASTTAKSSSAERIWHVKVGGKKIGPLSDEEVCGLALSRKVKPSSLAWKHGMQDWQTCSSIPELVRLFPSRSSWALKNPIPAIARKITRRHLVMVGAAALVVGALWAWRTYIYVPPYDDFVSVFATQTNGTAEEFAKVEKRADLYFYVPKQTGRWGDAEPLHQMGQKEFSELFGKDWKQTKPLGLVGQNGKTAILRVKQGWATDNFQCTTGYFVMRPSGPTEVSKTETKTLALPSLASKKPEPTATPSSGVTQEAMAQPAQGDVPKQPVAQAGPPASTGPVGPFGQPTATQSAFQQSLPERTPVAAGQDTAVTIAKPPEPTPVGSAAQEPQTKTTQDDAPEEAVARVTAPEVPAPTDSVEKSATSQLESGASAQKDTRPVVGTSDDQLHTEAKSKPAPTAKSLSEKEASSEETPSGTKHAASAAGFAITDAKGTTVNDSDKAATRASATPQSKPAPTPASRPVARQPADNKGTRTDRSSRPGGVSLLGGLVRINQAPVRTPASGRHGQKLVPVPQRPGEAAKVPDGSQSAQNDTPPPARPAPSPTPNN